MSANGNNKPDEPILLAAATGNLPTIRTALAAGADINVHDEYFQYTPLICATMFGHIDCATYLLEQHADVDAHDVIDNTALMIAIDYNNIKIVDLLLKHNASTEVKDKLGVTPLMKAARKGNIDCIELLFKYGAVIDTQDQDGINAAQHAYNTKQHEAAKFIEETLPKRLEEQKRRNLAQKTSTQNHQSLRRHTRRRGSDL